MSLEIVKEPPPAPSGPRMTGGCEISLVVEKTGEEIQRIRTPYYFVNERKERESPKY
jgi:hypothetical protein